ncbi:MAG: hypothetical protein ACI96P_002263, partial [Candidatus Azotimanducaceae bacterium]
MADIFLSYASADRERLRSLVEVFERLGYEVWWDRKLETGSAFDKEIELEVEAARCVVVVWSQHSVSSTWVRAEAMEALERDVLVPMQIDEIKLPLVFRSLQTPQLTGWPTTRSADALNQVLQAVEQTINGKTDRAKAPV